MVLHLVIDEFAEVSYDEAVESIVETIKENLEEKYWPHAINILDTLPRTQVGKVDYKKMDEDTKEICLTKGYLSEQKLNIINNTNEVKKK